MFVGLVQVYNKLPAKIVEALTLPIFKNRLQEMLKTSATNGAVEWFNIFQVVK